MRVYRVNTDGDHYQYFLPDDDRVWATDVLLLDGTPRLEGWKPPEIYVLKPRLRRGRFFDLCVGGLVLDSHATNILRPMLEMCGELLPLYHKGEEFFLLNVLECINVLDEERTVWVYGETTGARLHIEKYAFKPNRFTETSLFKTPETARSEVLAVEGLKDPEDEFKYVVEHGNLTGLLFELLWSDEES